MVISTCHQARLQVLPILNSSTNVTLWKGWSCRGGRKGTGKPKTIGGGFFLLASTPAASPLANSQSGMRGEQISLNNQAPPIARPAISSRDLSCPRHEASPTTTAVSIGTTRRRPELVSAILNLFLCGGWLVLSFPSDLTIAIPSTARTVSIKASLIPQLYSS